MEFTELGVPSNGFRHFDVQSLDPWKRGVVHGMGAVFRARLYARSRRKPWLGQPYGSPKRQEG